MEERPILCGLDKTRPGKSACVLGIPRTTKIHSHRPAFEKDYDPSLPLLTESLLGPCQPLHVHKEQGPISQVLHPLFGNPTPIVHLA
jgi:hypothetical protein